MVFFDRLDAEADSSDITVMSCTKRHQASTWDPIESLAFRVSAKLEVGNFGGAISPASSDDTLAAINDSTFAALQDKYPLPRLDSVILPFQVDIPSLSICDEGGYSQDCSFFPKWLC